MIHELEQTIKGKGECKGFTFEQVHEDDKGFIYQAINQTPQHYEVFLKRLTPVCIDFMERKYSDTEFRYSYPNANAFGKWAWTTHDYKKALSKLA